MNYSRLHRFKGSQKVHKGSQQNVKFEVSGQRKNFLWAGNKNWLTKKNLQGT